VNENDSRRIEDILEFAAELEQCVDLGESHFLENKVTSRAVERIVELIGEAASAISPEGRSHYQDVDWSGALGMRTWLAHAYHRINPELLWKTATESVPEMVQKLKS
jgi:uncharacterized protein with HEPN domain